MYHHSTLFPLGNSLTGRAVRNSPTKPVFMVGAKVSLGVTFQSAVEFWLDNSIPKTQKVARSA